MHIFYPEPDIFAAARHESERWARFICSELLLKAVYRCLVNICGIIRRESGIIYLGIYHSHARCREIASCMIYLYIVAKAEIVEGFAFSAIKVASDRNFLCELAVDIDRAFFACRIIYA